MFGKISISMRVKLISGTIAGVFAVFAGMLFIDSRANVSGLKNIESQYHTVDEMVLPLVRLTKQVQLDVTQVQQFLSDVSATRAQDGLGDGFEEAEKNATAFRADIAELGRLATALGDRELNATVAETEGAFAPFYEVGETMAHAYVDHGPKAGNAMMPDFDERADKLRKALEHVDTVTDRISTAAREATSGAISGVTQRIETEQRMVIGLFAVVLGFAAALTVFMIRTISNPIIGLAETMTAMSKGAIEHAVPHTEKADEVGTMARAVEVFRDAMRERARLEGEEIRSGERRLARQGAVDGLIRSFDAAVQQILVAVDRQIARMLEMAEGLTMLASDAEGRGTIVAGVAQETSQTVATVASATDELTASIDEINRQIGAARDVVGQAGGVASSTRSDMHELAGAADRIGEVVGLIHAIAAQTNLLALNATIEAARAGEAGRGFAVVAQEVKNLAQQTAKATEEISSQVGGIQSSTNDAVQAIEDIVRIMGDVEHVTGTIAATVEEQGAATGEIARNVGAAAQGTRELSDNFQSVARVVSETSHAAVEVNQLSRELGSQVEQLRSRVGNFLREVAAA